MAGAIRAAQAHYSVQRRLKDRPTARPSRLKLMKSETIGNPILRWLQAATLLNNDKDRKKLRRDLSNAGFDQQAAPVVYMIVRYALAIGLPAALLIGEAFSAKPMTGPNLVYAALLLACVGLIAPRSFLDNRINARKSEIEDEFPDALDLLVVCVEAGLGMEAAFVRVGHEVQESHPRIGEEFSRLARELSAGRGRAEALRAMAERTDVAPIKSFVALLIQTDSLGVSIGQSLRTYSIEMRQSRFLKAEEKAMRIPVLMTLPLVGCILPVMITVALLPAIIDMNRTVLPALRGMNH